MHRNYESTNAPTRINWFSDRIEIVNAGGPYGQSTIENLGHPGITDYRNPHIAEALHTLGFAQHFGVGIAIAREQLFDNGKQILPGELFSYRVVPRGKIMIGRVAELLVLTLSLAGCPPLAVVPPPPGGAAKRLVIRGQPERTLALSATPAGPDQLRLRITPKRPVKALPTVEVSVTGSRQVRPIVSSLDPATSTYLAVTPVTVGDQLLVVARAIARDDGAELLSTVRVNTAPLDPKEAVTAFSADGQLSITVPAQGLPPGSWLAIGPAEAPPPGGGDMVVVREPQCIAAGTPDDKLAYEGVIRFVLPDAQEGGAHPDFDPATARIERFDPQRNLWEPQPTEREPAPLTSGLMIKSDRLGIYAVTAYRR
jgi:hypothetical protein